MISSNSIIEKSGVFDGCDSSKLLDREIRVHKIAIKKHNEKIDLYFAKLGKKFNDNVNVDAEVEKTVKKTEELDVNCDLFNVEKTIIVNEPDDIGSDDKIIEAYETSLTITNVECKDNLFIVTVIFTDYENYPIRFLMNDQTYEVIIFDATSICHPKQHELLKKKFETDKNVGTVLNTLREICKRK